MDPEVATLFRRLAGLPSAERDAYYVQRGTPAAVRAEVESLLRFDAATAPDLSGDVAAMMNDALQPDSNPSSARGRGLGPGSQIGAYHVLSLLGAGGMGEVYRAHDSVLHRDVALKVLPPDVAGDAERIARFAREARTLAALNHPHIAQIHTVAETGDIRALVMELVEGETLADRIASGPLPVNEALDIASQIAQALEAAHELGIVHRDLKPANVKVRPDGTVKVLDFGLAKALDPVVDDDLPTLSSLKTGRVVLGTPAYMSPEQARGLRVDKRTDIWAFGCVLFEMFTGQLAFAGGTSSEVIAKILEREPDFSKLPARVPGEIVRMLRRCLAKDPKERLRDVGDARFEIKEALTGHYDSPQPATAQPRPANWRTLAAAVALAFVLAAGVAAWYLIRQPSAPVDTDPARLSISFVEPPRTQPFGERRLAISEDGRSIAYASASRLWMRRMEEPEPVAVASRAGNPFFSPGGDWIGFFSEAIGLLKAPVGGGQPIVVTRNTDRPAGATWGTDGTIVFATSEGLFQVSEEGGQPRLLASPDRERKQRLYAWPSLLPNRSAVLFTIVSDGSDNAVQTALLDLATRETRIVLPEGSGARYLPSGHLVYASGSTLKAVAFDPDTGAPSGEPISLGDIQLSAREDNGAADFAVSDSGTLIYLPAVTGRGILRELVWIDRKGVEERVALPPGAYQYPRVSPDGSRVALNMMTGGNRDIWILNLERLVLTQLTDGPGEDILPVWNPAGDRVYFGSDREGNFDIYSQAADGASGARVEFRGPGFHIPDWFTPDGRQLLVYEAFSDVGVLNFDAPGKLEPLLHSANFDERTPRISPDGQWLVYESNESGERFEVFLRPFPDVGARRELISVNGGRFPVWGPDGREIFYVDPDGNMMGVPVSLSPALSVGRPVRLFFIGAPSPARSGLSYDLSRADGRFLTSRLVAENTNGPTQVSVAVVLNFPSLLQRRLPAN